MNENEVLIHDYHNERYASVKREYADSQADMLLLQALFVSTIERLARLLPGSQNGPTTQQFSQEGALVPVPVYRQTQARRSGAPRRR